MLLNSRRIGTTEYPGNALAPGMKVWCHANLWTVTRVAGRKVYGYLSLGTGPLAGGDVFLFSFRSGQMVKVRF